jgi:hypothetical protein
MDDLERLDLGSEPINLRLKAGQALGTLATIDRMLVQLLRHKLEHFGQRRAGGHVELSAHVERDRQPQFLNARLDQFGLVVH